jgi:hypothetical protein
VKLLKDLRIIDKYAFKRGTVFLLKPIAAIIFCLISITIVSVSFAAGDDVLIVKSDGDVTMRDASGRQGKAVGTNAVLSPGSILATGTNGRAVVRMGHAGYIVLERNSKVDLGRTTERSWSLRQVGGMIYYALNLLKPDQRFEVRTTNAVCGVRGTRFLIVDTPERDEIGMRKGQVSVASPDGDFEIHKKAVQDEFEAYQQEGRDALEQEKRKFDEYKAAVEKDFVEYMRKFSLGENLMASFDGKRVVVRPLSAESENDMKTVESYAEEWLEKVRD